MDCQNSNFRDVGKRAQLHWGSELVGAGAVGCKEKLRAQPEGGEHEEVLHCTEIESFVQDTWRRPFLMGMAAPSLEKRIQVMMGQP